jgi:hypothetical protein
MEMMYGDTVYLVKRRCSGRYEYRMRAVVSRIVICEGGASGSGFVAGRGGRMATTSCSSVWLMWST